MIVTQEFLHTFFYYDRESGEFIRLVTYGGGRGRAGDRAGFIHNGYEYISIDYRVYPAHKLACIYMLGEAPREIVHKDGDKTNNRWNNIRPPVAQR